jgi:hypothetical protein
VHGNREHVPAVLEALDEARADVVRRVAVHEVPTTALK